MATIRKQTLKSGKIVYDIQVKATDKGRALQVVRTLRWNPEKGMSEKKAEREVILVADKFEKEVIDSISGCSAVSEPTTITFRAFCDKWLEKTKRDCSISYYVKSVEQLDLACEYIGGYKLRELTPAIIQAFFDKIDARIKTIVRVTPKPDFKQILKSYGFSFTSLRNDYLIQPTSLAHALKGESIGLKWAESLIRATKIPFGKLFDKTVTQEPYAYESNSQIKRTVRAVLALAKKNRLIQDNYASADYIDFPKRTVKPIEFMDDEEAFRFYDTLMTFPDIRAKTAMLLFLLTGFRRGEVCGLEWSDIDFDKQTISVRRSVVTVKGYGLVEKSPKTETSKRTITMPETLIQALKEYKTFWLDLRQQCGDYIKTSDRLFTSERGNTIHPEMMLYWLNKVLNAAHIEHHTLHSLRHTNITMQIAAGVPITTVSARAGHSKASTTSDIYSHFLQSSDKQAADVIDNIFKHKSTNN